MSNSNYAPRGTGIAKKTFLIFMGVMGGLMIGVGSLIWASRRQDTMKQIDSSAKMNDNTAMAQQKIAQIEAQPVKGNLVMSDSMPADQANQLSGTTTAAPVQTQNSVQVAPTGPVHHRSHLSHRGSGGVGGDSERAREIAGGRQSQISEFNNFDPSSQSSKNTPSESSPQAVAMLDGLKSQSANTTGDAGLVQNNNYEKQNMQGEKEDFMKKQKKSGNFYLSSRLTKPLSPYEVKASTLIPATFITGINSDLPGQISAQVSQNVYDTVSGNYLLIPQGTRIIGVYDNQVAYGQSRVLMAWTRLIFPNGDSFDLQGQPGVDLAGMAGISDEVNNHYARIFGSVLAISIFGAIGQISQPNTNSAYPTNAQLIYGAIGQNLVQSGINMLQKNMNIQPVITIRPGTNFNILMTRDMVLPGPYNR